MLRACPSRPRGRRSRSRTSPTSTAAASTSCPGLLERAIAEINDLKPDIVVCSGDLTTFGFKHEYEEARRYLDKVECEAMVVIPGNHDSRNVGYVHFEELFGERNSVLRVGPATVVAVDSTEPDLDHGQIGRGRYRWIEEQFAQRRPGLRVFVCHHHLLPVPGTGPRAEHDLRRRRHDRVPPARRRPPRPLRPQARSVRVEAREPLRRQHRHRLLAAPAGQHAALLQRRRGLREPRRGLAQAPVPRPGADHPVLARDARVREVHRAGSRTRSPPARDARAWL